MPINLYICISLEGVAYPVWTGIGAVGTVLVGIFFFHEPVTFWRMLFTLTLIVSIIGLKVQDLPNL